MEFPVKVLIPVAYDYWLSLRTVSLVYDYADTIQIALDKSRLTWTGEKFTIRTDYWTALKEIDVDDKIYIYEDEFFEEGQRPIVTDTKQRIRMAERAGEGGWHIQLDADEYFINFKQFVQFLRRCENHYGEQPVDVSVSFISMFKKDIAGFFVVWPPTELYPVATNKPDYKNVRSSHQNGRVNVKADSFILHDTWSRDEKSLATKLASWGHLRDFNVASYLQFWRSVDSSNYKYLCNFHPIDPRQWPKLRYFKGTLDQVLCQVDAEMLATRKSTLKGENKYFLIPSRVHLIVTQLKRWASFLVAGIRRA